MITPFFRYFAAPTFNVSCPDDIVVNPDEAVVSPDWLQATGNKDTMGVPAVVQCDPGAEAMLNDTETTITCTATDAGTMLSTDCSFTVIIGKYAAWVVVHVLGAISRCTLSRDICAICRFYCTIWR